jgi:hypothetical protein
MTELLPPAAAAQTNGTSVRVKGISVVLLAVGFVVYQIFLNTPGWVENQDNGVHKGKADRITDSNVTNVVPLSKDTTGSLSTSEVDSGTQDAETKHHTSVPYNTTAPDLSSNETDSGEATKTPSTLQGERRPLSCTWSPNSTSSECDSLLSSLVCSTNNVNAQPKLGRRVLIMGDSTMGPNFLFRSVRSVSDLAGAQNKIFSRCADRYTCQPTYAERCRNNALFGLEYPENNAWTPPDVVHHAEGPAANGLQNHFCTDCVSFLTAVLQFARVSP